MGPRTGPRAALLAAVIPSKPQRVPCFQPHLHILQLVLVLKALLLSLACRGRGMGSSSPTKPWCSQKQAGMAAIS